METVCNKAVRVTAILIGFFGGQLKLRRDDITQLLLTNHSRARERIAILIPVVTEPN
jgi:hypothetical protein